MTARTLPVAPQGVSAPLRDAVLAASDARSTSAATAALAALTASSSARASATPVREFIDDLASMLPIRLTVHQRDRLERSLVRVLDTLAPEHVG